MGYTNFLLVDCDGYDFPDYDTASGKKEEDAEGRISVIRDYKNPGVVTAIASCLTEFEENSSVTKTEDLGPFRYKFKASFSSKGNCRILSVRVFERDSRKKVFAEKYPSGKWGRFGF